MLEGHPSHRGADLEGGNSGYESQTWSSSFLGLAVARGRVLRMHRLNPWVQLGLSLNYREKRISVFGPAYL